MDMKKIEDLLAELKIAFGDNLISAVLYGSSVTGDSTPEFSRENLFLLLKDDALDLFRPALPALNKWVKAGHSIPHFFSERRFQDSEDVFPIEFSDIQAHHRILFGTDAVPHGTETPQQVFGDELYQIYYRFLETEDEYFDYAPAPVPPQGRWRIYGLGLPEKILLKVYMGNAARLLGI